MELCTKGEAMFGEVFVARLILCIIACIGLFLWYWRSRGPPWRSRVELKVRRSKETNGDERLWCMLLRI